MGSMFIESVINDLDTIEINGFKVNDVFPELFPTFLTKIKSEISEMILKW